MGLSSLDVDSTAEEGFAPGRGTVSSDYEAAKRAAGIPTGSQPNALRMGRGQGIGGFLGAPVYATKFRLDALSKDLLEPLADLLGRKDYLLRQDQLSSLDCLAFGYLSLLLYPAVPQAWLREAIQTKFPRIRSYIQRMRKELFSNENIDPASVWSISSGSVDTTISMLLPWQPRVKSFVSRASTGTREIMGNIPFVSSFAQRNAVVQSESTAVLRNAQSSLPSPLAINALLSATAVVAVGLASLAVHHRRSPRDGALIFWASHPTVGLGEAGNILSVLANQLPAEAYSQF